MTKTKLSAGDVLLLLAACVVLTLAIAAVWAVVKEGNRRLEAGRATSVYWLCNKDQIREILVNQPNGMSAAIATHCELHTYERKT